METVIKLEKVVIEESGCHLLVAATIDETEVRLVLDTGASRTVLDSNFFKKLNPDLILKEEEEKSIGVGSNQLDSFLVEVEGFSLSAYKLNNVQLALMDLSNVSLTYQNLGMGEVHGVLGGDILQAGKAVINYENETLILRSDN